MSDNATSLTVRCRLCEREFAVASPYAVSKAKYCPECRAVVDEERDDGDPWEGCDEREAAEERGWIFQQQMDEKW